MKLSARSRAADPVAPSELVRRINAIAHREGLSFAETVARALAGHQDSLGDMQKMDLKKLLDAWSRAA